MSVVVVAHFVETVILASDSRSTQTKSKLPSDTAMKILPLTPTDCVAVVGNPQQASRILTNLRETLLTTKEKFGEKFLKNNLKQIYDDTDFIDPNNSSCTLIFSGLGEPSLQTLPIEKIKEHWEKTNEQFLDGYEGVQLVMSLSRIADGTEITFNYPRTYVLSLRYPAINLAYGTPESVKELPVLEMDAWGSGSEHILKHVKPDFHKLWTIKGSGENSIFLKKMLFSIEMQDLIQNGGASVYIGGLPQIATVNGSGFSFHSFKKESADGNEEFSMEFDGSSWVQKNNSRKVVKTLPSLLSIPTWNEEEVFEYIADC